MVVQPTRLLIFVCLQIFLKTTNGFKIPSNTGKLQTDPLNIQSEILPFLEDIVQNRNVFINIETCKAFPSFLSVAVPNIDNSFKSVLSYGEECAMKYLQFKKLQGFEDPQSIVPPNPCLLPIVESTFPLPELSNPTSSGLRLPLQVTSPVAALDALCNTATDLTISNTCFTTSPPSCFDTSNPEIPYSVLPLPLTSYSNLDLAKFVNIEPSPPISLSVPAITTMVESNLNIINPLVSPRSIFTLPLAVTSTTYDIKQSQLFDSCLPSTSNIPSYLNTPTIALNNDELFVPTPNILPNPLIPLSVNYNEINAATPLSIDDINPALIYDANEFICPPLVDSEPAFYNCPVVPTSVQKLPVLFSGRGFYQGSTNLPYLDSKLTSPLYRNCHTLKPLPVCANALPSVEYLLPRPLPISEFNPYTLPTSLSTTPAISMIENTAANIYKTIQILDDAFGSPSTKSLPLTSLPSKPSLLGSLPVSNCLSSVPNGPLQSNSLLLFDDFPNSESEPFCNSCKRSPNVNEVPETSYSPALDNISVDINKTSTVAPSMKDTDIETNYAKKLQELISLVEMVIDDNVDRNTMNVVLSKLPTF